MKTSIRNDQRGLAQTAIVAIAVLVIGGVGLVGWRMTQKDSVFKNATPAQKAIINSCEKAFKDEELCRFAANSNIEKLAYKMVLTSTDPAGTKSVMNISTDGKGNNSVSGSNAGQAFDSILLNGVSYLKDSSDGKWFKFGKADSTAPKADVSSEIKVDDTFTEAASKNYEYKKLGKEACGKLTCLKYQFIDKTQPASTQYVWFDTDDYRMQRFSSKDANASTDMVLTYENVKISAPSPVKEFSPATDLQAVQQQAAASYQYDSSTPPPDGPSAADNVQ